jgi:hypothetical protein
LHSSFIELYATGNYGFRHLRDAPTDAGLHTKKNRRYDPRPISIHSLGTMLRDPAFLAPMQWSESMCWLGESCTVLSATLTVTAVPIPSRSSKVAEPIRLSRRRSGSRFPPAETALSVKNSGA